VTQQWTRREICTGEHRTFLLARQHPADPSRARSPQCLADYEEEEEKEEASTQPGGRKVVGAHLQPVARDGAVLSDGPSVDRLHPPRCGSRSESKTCARTRGARMAASSRAAYAKATNASGARYASSCRSSTSTALSIPRCVVHQAVHPGWVIIDECINAVAGEEQVLVRCTCPPTHVAICQVRRQAWRFALQIE